MRRHLMNFFLFILPPSRLFFLRRLLLRMVGVQVGKGACVCSGWIYGRGQLRIGNGTWLSPGMVAFTHERAEINIGNLCDIGPGVKFVTGGHSIGTSERRAGEGKALPIRIGDGCWIGAHCLILGGVDIGAGSIVAAGAVVTESVPENSMAAGVPAKVKRTL